MVIAVLQRLSKVPTLDSLPEWLESQSKKLIAAKGTSTTRALLMDFFIFFGDKYEKDKRVISPFTNRFINIQKNAPRSSDPAVKLYVSE